VLSLFVQKKCTVSEKIFVSKVCFSPPPKVDSSVIFFQTHTNFLDIDDNIFLAFIKASFSNPRKKMISNLSNF
jgi:16S rRNA A1518/A1519 N6-dimethyltransferase RsmA/KsgA/DIM1 with predicted DNA glycosylase/AP lyase activity